MIVQPGGVYGPGDHSELGEQMKRFKAGKLPALPFPDLGLNMVHVDDVAQGVLLALDKGRPGEAYVLGGELTTMRGVFEALAKVTGRKPPRFTVPTSLLKGIAVLGPAAGKLVGGPPNMREAITASDG